MVIKNNPLSLNVQRNLGGQHKAVQGTIGKLSSGEQVSKAMEGPATLISSERLRGRISSLDQASRNNETSVSMLQTAEGALSEVSEILTRMKQVATHAANEAANNPDELDSDQTEIEFFLNTINRIAQTTSFGHNKLLDGSRGVNGVTVGDHLTFISASEKTGVSPVKGFEVDVTQVAAKSYKVGNAPLTLETIQDGFQITVREEGKVASLDTRKGALGKEIAMILENYRDNPENYQPEKVSEQIRSTFILKFQETLEESRIPVEAWFSDSGLLVMQHHEYGGEPRFSVACTLPGIITSEPNIAEESILGKDIQGTIQGQQANGRGQLLTGAEGTEAEDAVVMFDMEVGFEEEFAYDENGAITQVKLVTKEPENIKAGDIDGYLHVSQKSPKFMLGSQVDRMTEYSLPDVRTSRMALGVPNKSEFRSLADIDVTTVQGAADANLLIEKAIEDVVGIRANIGAFQRNRLDRTANLMRLTQENTLRAESNIRDADVAEQMSHLAREQLQFSASQAMLAQANQRPQTVLQLIQ